MKKSTLITKALILLFLINLSCSKDNLEPNDGKIDTEIVKNDQTQNRPGDPCDVTTTVYAMYNFTMTIDGVTISILPEQQEIIKDNFEAEMSEHFSICEVVDSSCSDYDMWIVSNTEFWDYWTQDVRGQGSGSGTLGVRGGQAEWPDDPYSDCIFNIKN